MAVAGLGSRARTSADKDCQAPFSRILDPWRTLQGESKLRGHCGPPTCRTGLPSRPNPRSPHLQKVQTGRGAVVWKKSSRIRSLRPGLKNEVRNRDRQRSKKGQTRLKFLIAPNLANQALHTAPPIGKGPPDLDQPAQATLNGLTIPDRHSNPTFSSLTSSFQANIHYQLSSSNVRLGTSDQLRTSTSSQTATAPDSPKLASFLPFLSIYPIRHSARIRASPLHHERKCIISPSFSFNCGLHSRDRRHCLC